MFKAKIPIGVLKECVDVVRAIDDVVIVNISAGGWKIRVVDPANAAMVSFELDRNAFSDFQFETKGGEEEKIKIGVDFAALGRVLDASIVEKEAEVELELDEQAKNLFVKLDIFEYILLLNDPSSLIREPKPPVIDFSAQAIVETDKLIRSIHVAERINDHAMLVVEEGVLYLKAKDERNTLKSALSENVTKDHGNPHSTHSLDYLFAMTKAMQHTEDVTLELRSDYPVSIGFEIAEGQGKVNYLLAPRMPPDEDLEKKSLGEG